MAVSGTTSTGWRLGWLVFAVGIVVTITMSAHGLSSIALPHAAEWGPRIARLQLGNWLASAGFVILLLHFGNPVPVIGRQLAAQPALAAYVVCIALTLAYGAGRFGAATTGFVIDALLMPTICALSVLMLDRVRRHALLNIVVGLVSINAALGLAVSFAQTHLWHMPPELAAYTSVASAWLDPQAVFGQPVNSAIITATLLPLVLHLRIAIAWRCFFIVLLWSALLLAGDRTTALAATLVYGTFLLAQTALASLRGRFGYLQLTAVALLVGLAAAVLAMVIMQSGGEQVALSSRLQASARYWLDMTASFGGVGSAAALIALVAATWWLWQGSSCAIRLAAVQFVCSIALGNSLASITVCLAMLFLLAALVRRMPILRERSRRHADRPLPVTRRATE